MTRYADLHIHTNYSDSTLTPFEVVEQAYKNDIYCISITDHDTFFGYHEAKDLAKEKVSEEGFVDIGKSIEVIALSEGQVKVRQTEPETISQ